MKSIERIHVRGVLLVALLLVAGVLVLPVRGATRPVRYVIPGVPQVAQQDYTGCGAAALGMLLGHSGPAVDYREIVDVVRSMAHGTSLPDMARGGHFSLLSGAVSEAYPASQVAHGYTTRKLGHGSFFLASRTPWLDQLKDVVAQGCPVAVLTDWKPDEAGPHYRVVIGYDDALGVLYLHDPWPYGNTLARYGPPGSVCLAWPYADFLAVWSLSTDAWGLKGYRYGAVVSLPWKVRVQAPASVKPGETFTVSVTAEYCCPAPFGQGPEATFPTFPASDARFAVVLPGGLSPAAISHRSGGGVMQPIGKGMLRAGELSAPAHFVLKASPGAHGDLLIGVKASGRVSGHVPQWGTTQWNQAYDYRDVIGGEGYATVTVR